MLVDCCASDVAFGASEKRDTSRALMSVLISAALISLSVGTTLLYSDIFNPIALCLPNVERGATGLDSASWLLSPAESVLGTFGLANVGSSSSLALMAARCSYSDSESTSFRKKS